MMNWNGCGRKRSPSILRYSTSIKLKTRINELKLKIKKKGIKNKKELQLLKEPAFTQSGNTN
jgi:3-deoxy-D-manno-octulosonate 8-phosphate phosphatase KdsC-like HAD superfamily phosphatase